MPKKKLPKEYLQRAREKGSENNKDIVDGTEAKKGLQPKTENNYARKLYNIVVCISLTLQHKQRFKNITSHLLPRRDNATRWNFWYAMLDLTINKIRTAIITFCSEENELKDDILDASDWRNSHSIETFFYAFMMLPKD